MKFVFLALACLITLGCSDHRLVYCADGKSDRQPHKWSKWNDQWEAPNTYNRMLQRRDCEACGHADFVVAE